MNPAQFGSEDEDRLLNSSVPAAAPIPTPRPRPVEEVTAAMSADDPAPASEPNIAPVPKLPPLPGKNPFDDSLPRSSYEYAEQKAFLQNAGVYGDPTGTAALRGRYATEQERLAKEYQRQAAAAENEQKATDLRLARANGAEIDVDAEGRPTPRRDAKGNLVFKEDWIGAPRLDEAAGAWVQDRRRTDGSLEARDLRDDDRIHTDPSTGDFYFTDNGARTVIGKDEKFLKLRDLTKQISNIDLDNQDRESQIADLKASASPIEGDYNKLKGSYDKANQTLETYKPRMSEAGWLADPRNQSVLSAAQKEALAKFQAWKPIRDKYDPLRKRQEELETQKRAETRRRISLMRERDSIQETQFRPKFSALAKPEPGESPAAVAERETHGVAGQSYELPALADRYADFQLELKKADEESDALMPATLANPMGEAGLDVSKAGKLQDIRARRAAGIQKFARDRAVLEDYHAKTAAADLKAGEIERVASAIIARLASPAALVPRQDPALAPITLEKRLLELEAERDSIRSGQNQVKQAAWRSLQSDPAEFPESLITETEKGHDIAPNAVALRAAGRSAAFHMDERVAMVEVLEDIEKAGKIKTIGGEPVESVIKRVRTEQALRVEDLLTAPEAEALRQGLRSGLITHQRALLHNIYDFERELQQNASRGLSLVPGKLKANAQKREGADKLGPDPAYQQPDNFNLALAWWRDRHEERSSIQIVPALPADRGWWKDIKDDDVKSMRRVGRQYATNLAMRGKKPLPPLSEDRLEEIGRKVVQIERQRNDDSLLRPKSSLEATQNAIGRGYLQALTALEFANEAPSAERIAEFQYATGGLGQSQAYESAMDGEVGLKDTVKAFVSDPVSVLGEALGESAGAFLTTLGVAAPARVAIGAGIGASAGSFVPGVGTLSGAGVGVTVGLAEASYVASKALEMSGGILESLQEAGIDVSDPVALKSALSDEAVMTKARSFAEKKAIPVALFDGASALIGGKLFLTPAKTAGRKIFQGLTELGVQGLLGSAGESAGQINQKGHIEDWKAVAAEGLLEAPTSFIEIGTGLGTSALEKNGRDRAFDVVDRTYRELSRAVRSDEALQAFNDRKAVERPGSPQISMATARSMLNATREARNATAADILLSRKDIVERFFGQAVGEKADVDAAMANLRKRSHMLPFMESLGRETADLLIPAASMASALKDSGVRGNQARTMRHVVAGAAVIDRLEAVAKGETIKSDLGKRLEERGFLIQKPTADGGTRWVLSAPAVRLLSGETRRAIASDPKAFSVDIGADTKAPGEMETVLGEDGDDQISRGLAGDQPANQATTAGVSPSAQGTFTVTLNSEPDAGGFVTSRTVKVQAASASEAGVAALSQTRGWRGKWTPTDVSPDLASAEPYSTGSGESTSGNQPGAGDALRAGERGVGASDEGVRGGQDSAIESGSAEAIGGPESQRAGGSGINPGDAAPKAAQRGQSEVLGADSGVSGTGAEAHSVAPGTGRKTVSLPLMITRAQEAALAGLGYPDIEVRRMTPQQAQDAIAGKVKFGVAEKPSDSKRVRALARILANKGVEQDVAVQFARDVDARAGGDASLNDLRDVLFDRFRESGGVFLEEMRPDDNGMVNPDPEFWKAQGMSEQDAHQSAENSRAWMEENGRRASEKNRQAAAKISSDSASGRSYQDSNERVSGDRKSSLADSQPDGKGGTGGESTGAEQLRGVGVQRGESSGRDTRGAPQGSPKEKRQRATVAEDQPGAGQSDVPASDSGVESVQRALSGRARRAAVIPAKELPAFIRGEHPDSARALTDDQLESLLEHFASAGDSERGRVIEQEISQRGLREMSAATEEALKAGHYELLEALLKLGGIKTPESGSLYAGELGTFRESRLGKRPGLFSKTGLDLDRLATMLRDYGFDFETGNDLIGALSERAAGRKIYGITSPDLDYYGRFPYSRRTVSSSSQSSRPASAARAYAKKMHLRQHARRLSELSAAEIVRLARAWEKKHGVLLERRGVSFELAKRVGKKVASAVGSSIRVVGTYDELARELHGKMPAGRLAELVYAEGLFHPTDGPVLIAQNIAVRPGESHAAAVARVALHELVGHQGLREAMKADPNAATVFDRVVSEIPEKELSALATLYTEFSKWQSDPAAKAALAEEWFAERAAEALRGTEIHPLLGRLLMFIRHWLSKMSFPGLSTLEGAVELIAASRSALRRSAQTEATAASQSALQIGAKLAPLSRDDLRWRNPVHETSPGGFEQAGGNYRITRASAERVGRGIFGRIAEFVSKPDESPIRARPIFDGRIVVEVDSGRLIRQGLAATRGNVEAFSEYLSDVFGEEIIHAQDLALLREKWEDAGREMPFDRYVKREVKGLISDIESAIDRQADPAVKGAAQTALDAAAAIYGTSSPLVLGAEFTRQLLQQSRTGGITEERFLRTLADFPDKWSEALGAIDKAAKDLPADAFGARFAVLRGDMHAALEVLKANHPEEPVRFSRRADSPASEDDGNVNSKASTQINIPRAQSRIFTDYAAIIPDSEIYSKEGYGREKQPHVTVLYGLEASPELVQEAVGGRLPVELKFGKTSIFESEDYDVLKVDILGPGIRALHAALQKAFPTKSDFPDYKPHLTIAYLKKGEGKKYVGDTRFEGLEHDAGEFVFSGKDDVQTPVRLRSEGAGGQGERTLATVGEDRLLREDEMPWNLVGEQESGARRSEERADSPAMVQDWLFSRREAPPSSAKGASEPEKYSWPADMQKAGSAQRKLVFENMGLASAIAHGFGNISGIAPDDLRQEAQAALARAARIYDPAHGIPFSSYARTIIRNRLIDLYRKDANRAFEDSLDRPLADDAEETLGDVVAVEPGPSPNVSAERKEVIDALREVIATLAPDLRDIVNRRMAGQTLAEVGAARGIQKQSVHQAEQIALAAIKLRLKARGIDRLPVFSRRKASPATQDTFAGKFDPEIFPPAPDGPVPPGADDQETFTAVLDKEIFSHFRSEKTPADLSETAKGLPPEEAGRLAKNLMGDADDVGTMIAEKAKADFVEERGDKAPGASLRDLYAWLLKGRYDFLDYVSPGLGARLRDSMREEADFAAALRLWNESLNDRIKQAFGYPSWWRNPAKRALRERFRADLLPYASQLNPVSRNSAGEFVFKPFWQRAGEWYERNLQKAGRRPGEKWQDKTGQWYRVSSEKIALDPKKPGEGFYQLERYIPAEVQKRIYEGFHQKYENFQEAAWLLDQFIDPAGASERVTSPQGVELPSLNRHSLYSFYGDTPAGLVSKIEGYTPDVARLRSIAGFVAGLLRMDWQSPGRDYKSGQARESGMTYDLIKGFNLRAAQAHLETVRRKNAEIILRHSMKPIPETGVPDGWRALDKTLFNPLILAMRDYAKVNNGSMEEIVASTTDALTQKNLETLKFLFEDPALFNPAQMVPREVISELERGFVTNTTGHAALDAVFGWIKSSVVGVLADPFTYAVNMLSNEIFKGLYAAQQTARGTLMLLAGERAEAKYNLRTAGNLMRGFFTPTMFNPAFRERLNRLAPPELFDDQNILRQVMQENADATVVELLKQLNVSGAILKGIGYGELDTKAKQKLALASLLSRASIAADERDGIFTDAKGKTITRRQWMDKWVEAAPVEARREAETAARLYLLDYSNVPFWLDPGTKVTWQGKDVTPWVNFLRAVSIPFWRFPYGFAKQIKRTQIEPALALRGFLPGNLKVGGVELTRGAVATKSEKIDALSHLIAHSMLVAAGWLLLKPWDDDDDDDILGRDFTDAGEEMDPKFRTGGRVRAANSSIAGMAVNTAARMLGAELEGADENWIRVRSIPYATQAIAIGTFLRTADAYRKGEVSSAKPAQQAAMDILEDFMSVGTGARLFFATLGYEDRYSSGQRLDFKASQTAFDWATGRVIPPRLLKDIAAFVDPVARRYKPSESLDYSPGILEGLASKIPGATTILAPSGRVEARGAPDSEKTREARLALTAMGLEGIAYREYVDKDGKIRAAYVRPEFLAERPTFVTYLRWLGISAKSVDADGRRAELEGTSKNE